MQISNYRQIMPQCDPVRQLVGGGYLFVNSVRRACSDCYYLTYYFWPDWGPMRAKGICPVPALLSSD